jgi:transcriptional regulator with XRE-family HTH domain
MDTQAVSARLRTAMETKRRRKLFAFSHEIGVSPSTVTRWLQGQPISSDNLVRLAEALDISIDWLLMGKGDMSPTALPASNELDALRRLPPDAKAALRDLFSRI